MTQKELVTQIEDVQHVFPDAMCISLNGLEGFGILWPLEAAIVATAQHPKKAWANAHKLIKGKNKKALERLKKRIIQGQKERA